MHKNEPRLSNGLRVSESTNLVDKGGIL